MARRPGTRIRNYNVEPSKNLFGPKAVEPHSPWQLLIERARLEKGISLREFAAKSEIPSGTIFNWVRSKQGCPTRSNYTSTINNKIAAAIGLDPEELASAYNQSAFRPVDPNVIEPESKSCAEDRPLTVLERFLAVLRQSGKDSFTLNDLEFYKNGSSAEFVWNLSRERAVKVA
jgi:transcriptional regulator with XRE-family HTH domain